MNRTVRWVLAIVAVQAALIGLYWLVEHQRASDEVSALGTASPRRVDMTMPALTVRLRDGSAARLPSSGRSSGRHTLVHVWATWCPPCREELPGLLALPTEHAVDVVAIALDKSWVEVDRFLGGVDASNVFLADSEDVERALGVRNLPVTFLLQAEGRITLRFDGARDWTDEAFVKTYLGDAVDDR